MSYNAGPVPSNQDVEIEPRLPETRPVERRIKAHRKSREGCFACKGRKIKCCESRPRCSSCAKAGLQCVYPESKAMAFTANIRSTSSYSGEFSLSDMRFFHNYMTASLPRLPMDAEKAWQNEIPIIAQQHEFLMLAIMALGASHLHARTDLDPRQTVERHRARALHGLTNFQNGAAGTLANGKGNETRLNAQLATAYALTFCASYLGDPISQFLVLVRGCASLSAQIMQSGHSSLLFPNGGQSVSHHDHLQAMRGRLESAPALPDSEQITAARLSLRAIVERCTLTSVEAKILALMQSMLDNIDAPVIAYASFVDIWNTFTDMSSEEFSHLVNPFNTAGFALQAHFLALEKLVRPWLIEHAPTRGQDDSRARGSLDALQAIPRVDAGSEKLLEWPLSFVQDAVKICHKSF
ncbi:hypothetical protein LTR09_012684 [Extremus antarcticus]|uniref:Zn(2)-C6 fungal-type domain-containing protein n=1 Tax=Extremus antarcticus TaxID=702011 RepID=A0AAJ0D9G6_9PEZI|nr:hypothetical protein LTR09_012684 [Extremus antarcticus]